MTSAIQRTDCLRLALALRLAAYHAGAEEAKAATTVDRISIAPELVTEAADALEAIGGRIDAAQLQPLAVQDRLLEALASSVQPVVPSRRKA